MKLCLMQPNSVLLLLVLLGTLIQYNAVAAQLAGSHFGDWSHRDGPTATHEHPPFFFRGLCPLAESGGKREEIKISVHNSLTGRVNQ
jgi:hypothetical protein